MRIKGGVGRVMVETPRRQRERRPPAPVEPYYRDAFEITPVKAAAPSRSAVTTLAVVLDLAQQGRARVQEDEQRERAQLVEIGRFLGGLTADLVVELINHFVQRPPGQRSAPMVVLGGLTSALFVEFWSVLKGDEALDRTLVAAEDAEAVLEQFVSFIENTEGDPARRLLGTLYAQ